MFIHLHLSIWRCKIIKYWQQSPLILGARTRSCVYNRYQPLIFASLLIDKISLTLSYEESRYLPQAKRNFQKEELCKIIYLNSTSYLFVYTYHKYIRTDKFLHRKPWQPWKPQVGGRDQIEDNCNLWIKNDPSSKWLKNSNTQQCWSRIGNTACLS